MKTKKLLTVFTLLVAVLIAGCKKDDYQETVGVCPIVISTDPTSSATGVSLNQIIEVTFNQKMNPLTINSGAFTLVNPAASKDTALKTTATVEGTVTYNTAKNTMYFEPSENLLPNTTYKGTVFTTVKDLLGNAIQQNYVWSFTTGVIVSPTVILTSPLPDVTGVALNSVITAKFSVPMNPLTITAANFMVKNGLLAVPGVVTYDELINTATFTPSTPLLSNTVYTSTITTGTKNTLGNPLLGNYTWNFTTINTTPPAVILTDPLNTATGIAMNKTITAIFNIPLDATTISNTTFLVKNNLNVPVAGAVTYTGTTASFNPTNPLDMNTVYTATLTTGVKSKDGFAMAANYVWSFTTSNFIAPTVILTDPLDNATGVALNKTITATFSVPMDPLTITGTTFTVKNGANAVAGTVSYNGTTATFNPNSSLLSNTVYTVTITTGAKNTNGFALANNKVWDFTTLNNTLPTVILTDPLDNATGVALNKTITATFSVPMDPLTITGTTFTVKNGNNAVAGTVSYNGTTATFNPNSSLLSNTVYTVTITTGAKNTNGFALANDKVWDFTTLNDVIPIPAPSLGRAAAFGAFGGNAGITNQGLNTVINNGSIATTAASTLVTGFHDSNAVYTETPLNVGNVTGDIFTAPPAPGTAASFKIASDGLLDANAAYLSISPASKPGGIDPGAGELGGLTLAPGIYKSASGTFKISNGDLTLDGKGDPNAVWIFQTASGLTVGIAGPAGARSVKLIGGAAAKNVFWYVGSAATINGAGGGVMTGNIIATAGVTFSTAGNAVQTVLNGRAISLVASVTMVNTTINVPNQ